MAFASALFVRIALAAVLFAPALAPAHAADMPRPETATLDNGLELVVIPDRRAPVVTHMLWYRVGAADEPPGHSGIAHFLEHLMFKGTPSVPDGRFSQVVAANGGQDNAFTSYDYTAYFQRVARDRLGVVMEMEADRMRNLVLDPQVVATEREVIQEERRQRTDNSPGARLNEAMNAALYRNHPYGVPIIGWAHEIAALDRESALDFYDRFYAPNNAVLVVAGDVTMADVLPLAEEFYGPIPRGTEVVRTRPMEPPQTAPRRVRLEDPRVAAPQVSRLYQAPSARTAAGEDAALDVLAEILGGRTGRFYQGLVVDRAIAAGAGAYYQSTALDYGVFALYATASDGTDAAALEAALDETLQAFLAEGPTAEELDRARRSLIASAVYAQDSQSTLARIFGSALTTGLGVDEVLAWPDRIRAVTADDVMAAARAVLVPEASVTGVLVPAPQS